MRIAFSGTHRVGKSTLLEAIASHLPDHATIDEPYYQLEDDGHDAPDFESQLARSISSLASTDRDILFDRCPADLLAYLHATGAPADDLDPALAAIETLDLIVFVPIESPDRISLSSDEDPALRRAVHDILYDLLINESLGTSTEILLVEGDLRTRVAHVLSALNEK
jgi:predicted ATPase